MKEKYFKNYKLIFFLHRSTKKNVTQTISTRSIRIQVQNDEELGNNSGSDVKPPNESDRIIVSNIQVSF